MHFHNKRYGTWYICMLPKMPRKGFQKEHTGLPATVHTIHDNGREAK